MKLSILIPVYNEESTIGDVIREVVAVDLPGIEKEIIVIDDGSTDATSQILKNELGQNATVLTVHTSEQNFGKGMAIRTGLKYVSGEIVLIQDADLELAPNEYVALLKPLIHEGASVVYGSRFLNGSNQVPWRSLLAQKILCLLTNFLYGSALTDEATAYKLFRAEVIKNIRLDCIGFEFCPEVTAKLLRQGCEIKEIPITYHPRTKAEGKKINYLKDGLFAVYTLLKLRFSDRIDKSR